jgi:putative intracellular protease/amidase
VSQLCTRVSRLRASAGEAVHTGVLAPMYVILLCASAVTLFDVAFLGLLATRLSTGAVVLAVCTAGLLGMNGAGRSLAIRMAASAGRHRTLGRVLGTLGAGQVCLAGAGGGAFYPLFASLTREYSASAAPWETNAVICGAKAFGGVLGVGIAALVRPAWRFAAAVLVAGTLALGSAAVCAGAAAR